MCRAATGRALHARLFGDVGLLGRARRRRAEVKDAPAGCTPAICRRSTPRATATSRTHQGHGDSRRRKPLSARDRGISVQASRRCRRSRCSASRRERGSWGGTAKPTPLRVDFTGCAPRGETLSADEVRAFCQGQIAHNKTRRYVEFVSEFPMTVDRQRRRSFSCGAAVEGEALGLCKAHGTA